nr:hypothetical protein RVX_3155 [Nitratidesulfovibrio sp. HK-II]
MYGSGHAREGDLWGYVIGEWRGVPAAQAWAEPRSASGNVASRSGGVQTGAARRKFGGIV